MTAGDSSAVLYLDEAGKDLAKILCKKMMHSCILVCYNAQVLCEEQVEYFNKEKGKKRWRKRNFSFHIHTSLFLV